MLQDKVKTTSAAKQEELGTALLEKTALLEGVQRDLQTCQAALNKLQKASLSF